MGSISFESWSATIDNMEALNAEPEISRLKLVFERFGRCEVSAQARGNVSGYYVIVQELLRHLTSGALICEVTLSSGEMKKLEISPHYVSENDEDIGSMFLSD